MTFSWINAVNGGAVLLLLLCNIIAACIGIAGEMQSRHRIVNMLEQIGRYFCMALMIVPLVLGRWEFAFSAKRAFLLWITLTVILMAVYMLLWFLKRTESPIVLYGLAVIPAMLFVANGILLQHWLLLGAGLLFGTCHLWIVAEHIRSLDKTHTVRETEK